MSGRATSLRVTDPPPLPAIARQLKVGMPHLDAGGLSEGWLLRYAGDLHWEAIGHQLAAASDEIRSDWGQRLYPTFVAVRARYAVPLASVRENDVLEAAAEVIPCGRACAHGRVVALVGGPGQGRGHRLQLEMLTTFAVRAGNGQLQMALPAARLARRWSPTSESPPIARLARVARRQATPVADGDPADGEAPPLLEDDFLGPSLAPPGPPLGSLTYQPSPYADYNGAGLLYFAAYVTIADTAERLLVQGRGLEPLCGDDWALGTSPVRRDVFYYRNLPLGQALVAELLDVDLGVNDRGGGRASFRPSSVRTRMRLRRADDGQVMADLVTERRVLGPQLNAGEPGGD